MNLLCPPPNIIGGSEAIKEELAESQTINVNLHIGVFFDGTNNNKVQSMLALSDRRKKFYKRHKKELKNLKIANYEDMLKKDKKFFCDARIGTTNELDSIFGSSTNFDLFMEQIIATDNETIYRQATSADDYNEKSRNTLKKIADRKKTLDLFMGGGNSAGASNYTNIAILSSLYETSESKEEKLDGKKDIDRFHSVYIEGVGTTDELNLIKNIARLHKSVLGLGFGIGEDGLSNKCKQATKRVLNIIESYSAREDISCIRCYFDVFGFSRGAATARAFIHILNPNNSNIGDEYLNTLCTGNKEQFLEIKSNKIVHKEIQTLGLFDTVSAIGVLREECSYLLGDKILNIGNKAEFNSGNENQRAFFHDTNVTDFGLYSTDQAKNVLHICALDEFRKNFALVNIESSIESKNGLELYIPGCHTDIGGGSKLGLDNPKIINFDEIATKSKILYLIYVRANGIIMFLKSASTILAKLSNAELLLLPLGEINNLIDIFTGPLGTIKTLIRDFHTSVSGLFSAITGFENLAEYDANKGITPSYLPNINNNHSLLYKWTTEAQQAITDDLPNKIKKLPPTIIEEFNTFNKFVTEDSLIEKVQTGADLVEGAIDIIKLCIDIYKKVRNIYNGLINLKNAKSGTRWKGVKSEIDAFIKNEVEEWKYLGDLSKETSRMIELMFNGEREDLIIPLEHRRICMYTGEMPYGNIDDNVNIKPMCIKTLKDAGWLPDTLNPLTKKTFFSGRATKDDLFEAEKNGRSVVVDCTRVTFFTRQNILVYKYCKPGYSNIALKAMYDWANLKRNNMFTSYPTNAYPIPEDLTNFYEQISSKIKQELGRVYCVPKMNEYKELRCKYLHISMNQQANNIGDNGLINGPSFKPIDSNLSNEEINKLRDNVKFEGKNSYTKDSLIARRIYVGKNPSETAGGKEFNAHVGNTKWLFD